MSDSKSTGIEFGAVFAMIISWTKWHSFGWAIVHSLLGWIYIIYYFLVKGY